MLQFWRNPEFIRHVRAELRPARVLTVIVITYVVIGLTGMAIFNQRDPMHENPRIFYSMVTIGASALLLLWCLSVAAQAIAGERELKTFDFLRTTRLTAGELLVGKVFGGPVMAYVIFACAAPVMIVAGLGAGYGLGTTLTTIVMVVATALLLNLFGIWISMQVEKMNRGAGVLALFFLWPLLAFGSAPMQESYLPAIGCLSPYPAIAWAHGEKHVMSGFGYVATGAVPIFGLQLPYAVVTLLLYATFGAWLTLMIVRNLKRDLEEVRLLTRWQAIGLAFYLNVLFYAFLDLQKVIREKDGPLVVTMMAIFITGATIVVVGLSTLSPPERLKVWERERVGGRTEYLSEDGLPWPWMIVVAAMGYALLAVQGIALSHSVPLYSFDLPMAAVAILFVLTFAMRDVVFLQWCKLTRMKSPVRKGVLWLVLYYFAAGIVISIALSAGSKEGLFAMRVLTPVYYFEQGEKATAAAAMLTAVAVQGAVVVVLLAAIMGRLKRTLAIARA